MLHRQGEGWRAWIETAMHPAFAEPPFAVVGTLLEICNFMLSNSFPPQPLYSLCTFDSACLTISLVG